MKRTALPAPAGAVVAPAAGTAGPMSGRAMGIGLLSLMAFTVAAVGISRLSGPLPHTEVAAAVVAQVALRFEDEPDGSIRVLDAGNGATLALIAPGSDGFMRSTMRGLARERYREGLGPRQPFQLSYRSDGELILSDPATGRTITLRSFGATNAAAFARLLAHHST